MPVTHNWVDKPFLDGSPRANDGVNSGGAVRGALSDDLFKVRGGRGMMGMAKGSKARGVSIRTPMSKPPTMGQ